jgi:hypothetical protein
MSDHIKQCYKLQFNDGSLLKLPDANTYMKFEKHKNKLTRPFIVYADCESTLLPTNHKNKINKHKINSCCCFLSALLIQLEMNCFHLLVIIV